MGYWLMKSEPDCYSIDDLAAKGGPDVWEGCRNWTVRNFFKDKMQPGDLAFFYNSSCPVPGVAGIMEVVGDAYPDPTQFDPKSQYFDPKSRPEAPRWVTRDVTFLEKFEDVVPLSVLRVTPGLENALVNRRGQRLSVMPVTADEWKVILSLAKRR
ncbi:MAG: EVE domain-containing protein [Armatimonadetes bacterium]|nr:EVE domain-containing protein [Armatimonadota bacterium]